MSRSSKDARHRSYPRMDTARKKKSGHPAASYVMRAVPALGSEPGADALHGYAMSFRPGEPVVIDRRAADPVRHGGAITVRYTRRGEVAWVHPQGCFILVRVDAPRPYLESFWPEEINRPTQKGGKS